MARTPLPRAVTRSLTRPEQTPHLPVTPAQIASEAPAAVEAGAAIVDIDLRDPASGRPSLAVELPDRMAWLRK